MNDSYNFDNIPKFKVNWSLSSGAHEWDSHIGRYVKSEQGKEQENSNDVMLEITWDLQENRPNSSMNVSPDHQPYADWQHSVGINQASMFFPITQSVATCNDGNYRDMTLYLNRKEYVDAPLPGRPLRQLISLTGRSQPMKLKDKWTNEFQKIVDSTREGDKNRDKSDLLFLEKIQYGMSKGNSLCDSIKNAEF
mmetsp:Transcript_19606/g.23541  ORF Transcript_19606/g.23541 Transcript_19606/m.23541 type:complete len:194 (-) Transcript_19606:62-643(-)